MLNLQLYPARKWASISLVSLSMLFAQSLSSSAQTYSIRVSNQYAPQAQVQNGYAQPIYGQQVTRQTTKPVSVRYQHLYQSQQQPVYNSYQQQQQAYQQQQQTYQQQQRTYQQQQRAYQQPSYAAPVYDKPKYALPKKPAVTQKKKTTITVASRTPSHDNYNLPPKYRRQMVDYFGEHKPGTIVINTEERLLYHVLEGNKAMRYGIGVARPGFEWSGYHKVTRKKKWPSWTPPAAMRKREPNLPKFMEGGPDNPMGARALYLGSTLYRIHGSNAPWSIGHNVSSGCIRMTNDDVIHLYKSVGVGTSVYVI